MKKISHRLGLDDLFATSKPSNVRFFHKGGKLIVTSIHIYEYSLDFLTKMKSKTIFQTSIPSPFGRSNRFFDRWPFLAVFGHFWPFLAIFWPFTSD